MKQVWPNVFYTCLKIDPVVAKIARKKSPGAKIVVLRTATGAFPSPKALYRMRTIVLSAKNRGILGYTL